MDYTWLIPIGVVGFGLFVGLTLYIEQRNYKPRAYTKKGKKYIKKNGWPNYG